MKRRVAALVMALVFCVSSMSVTAAETTESPTQTETNKAEEEVVSEEKETEEETEQTPTDPVEETKDEEGKEEETTAQGETSAQEEGQEEVVAEGAIMATAVALGEDSTMVAKIGETEYPSLQAAVAEAEKSIKSTPEKSTEIVLLKDTNDGLDIGNSSGTEAQNIIINLNGHTLTLGPAIGSTGTETNGLRVLAYSKLEVKNGTVVCSNMAKDKGGNVKVGMANYGTLTLTDVDFQSGNYVLYTINNRGALTLSGTTKVESGKAGSKIAITNDPYNYYYTNFDASLTIDSESVSVGTVQLERYGNSQNTDAKVVLNISAGAIDEIVEDGKNVVSVQSNITGGIFKNDPTKYVSDEYTVITNADGTYTVSEKKVAQIGETTYTSLKKAIEAAKDGETVKLLKNISGDVTISEGISLVLDLNGYTMSNVGSNDTISNYGTLTITDSSEGKTGVVDNVTNGKGVLVNYPSGTVTINDGTLTRSAESANTNSWYTIKNMGTMTIAGGKITTGSGSTGASSLIANGWYYGSYNLNNTAVDRKTTHTGTATANLTITGGNFSGGMNTVKNDDWSVLNISGGNFSNTTGPVILNWNEATVSGGTFVAKTGHVIANGYCGESSDKGQFTITGGTFISGNSGVDSLFGYGVGATSGKGKLTIQGGGFTGISMKGNPYVIEISGGYFSKEVRGGENGLIAEGKECVRGSYPFGGYTYSYTIATVGEMVEVVIDAGKTDGTVSSAIPQESKSDANRVMNTLEGKQEDMEASVAKEQQQLAIDTATADKAKEKLEEKGVTILESTTISTVIEPYMRVEVKGLTNTTNKKEVVLDIQMLYNVKATTNPEHMIENPENGETKNTVTLSTGNKVSDPQPTYISFQIPKDMYDKSQMETNGEKLYIEHKKADGSVYYHEAELNEDGSDDSGYDTVTFLNDKGYSTFVLKAGTEIPADRPYVAPAPNPGTGTGSSSSSSSHSSSSVKTVTAAKTGDNANVWTPMLMMLAALAVSGGCVVYSRKKKQAEE